MTKQKTIPELEAEKAGNEKELAQLRHKKQRFKNRIAYYESKDRQTRTHRLITRGAAIESGEPQAKQSMWMPRSKSTASAHSISTSIMTVSGLSLWTNF